MKPQCFAIALSTILPFTAIAATDQAIRPPEIVSFRSDKLALKGLLYKPNGSGPFPAMLYNHGSAPGILSNQAAEKLGPLIVSRGWVFFMPYRRGQGLSESVGPYIMDQIGAAERSGGTQRATETLIRLLTADHLDDQLAALAWLKKSNLVSAGQIAVAGNSFGGIQAVLGAHKGSYCAGISAAGAAQIWANSPELQNIMTQAVRQSRIPLLFFQAENDFDLSPSKVLSDVMRDSGKTYEMKIYPAFGKTQKDGHAFAYMGGAVWGDDVFRFLAKHCNDRRKTK